MQYLLLVYTDESSGPAPDSAEEEIMWVAHEDFSRHGRVISGRALHASDTATTVRLRDGATLTTDGPHSARGEQLAGFYLIDAEDLDQAIDTAARVPCASYASVEVRPVVDLRRDDDG